MEASFTVAVLAALAGATVLWVWALVDVLTRPDATAYRNGNQVVWTVVIAVTHVIGAALYLAVGRTRRASAAAAGGEGRPRG